MSRRGPLSSLGSDNGRNFVAGNKDLKSAIGEWNSAKINKFCQQNSINWKFNPPYSSHFGGVYEREIRTIRKVLDSLLKEFHNQIKITDEMLLTLMCEVENTLNSRPLNAVSVDTEDLEAITPNHLLKTKWRS